MARRLKCPQCGNAKDWILSGDRRRCAHCRHDWRPGRLPLRVTSRDWQHVLGWFVRGMSAQAIAHETGLRRERVLRALTLVRRAMPCAVPPVFQGTVEVDETYVGSRWRNWRAPRRRRGSKPGRGTLKTPVFGILCRGGQVWAQVVPDLAVKTLFPLIGKHGRRGSIVCTDALRLYTGIAAKGYVHRLVQHELGECRSRQGTHINGLEGFWGYVTRRLAAKGGIRRERLPLYIAEYVWRYNHRRWSPAQQVKALAQLLKHSPRRWKE